MVWLAAAARALRGIYGVLRAHKQVVADAASLVGAGRASKVVSSPAFHLMQAEMQAETLASIWHALKPGGVLRVADFSSGSHLPGPTGRLASDIAAAGFQNVRTLAAFRVAFADVTLVGAEKPHDA